MIPAFPKFQKGRTLQEERAEKRVVECAQCGRPTKRGRPHCSNQCFAAARRFTLPYAYSRCVVKTLIGCWGWGGATDESGYGVIHTTAPKRKIRAHRLSWELHNGQIPDGMCVLHRCDNPPCTNPMHLFLGTVDDNNADRQSKNRTPRGSALSFSKLNDGKVRELWKMRAAGVPATEIAKALGVSTGPVWAVIRGITWRHVERSE